MVVGITGGIGSGKSTVAKFLKKRGYLIIDGDEISRELVMPGKPCLQKLARAFGTLIIKEDGQLDRKELGIIAFGNPEKKQILDQIMMEAILEEIHKRMEENKGTLTFVDAPLLFETGLYQEMDETLLVTAKKQLRMERVMKRDGLTTDQIEQRISFQMPEEKKKKLATAVIENNGNKAMLKKVAEEWIKQYE